MTVDARGYSCPMPVVMVQKAVKGSAPDTLEVLVDNRCSVENVTRFAENSGYKVSAAPEGEDFRLTLSKCPAISPRSTPTSPRFSRAAP